MAKGVASSLAFLLACVAGHGITPAAGFHSFHTRLALPTEARLRQFFPATRAHEGGIPRSLPPIVLAKHFRAQLRCAPRDWCALNIGHEEIRAGKQRLLSAVAKGGINDVLSAARELEVLAPANSIPSSRDLVGGEWSLVFSTQTDSTLGGPGAEDDVVNAINAALYRFFFKFAPFLAGGQERNAMPSVPGVLTQNEQVCLSLPKCAGPGAECSTNGAVVASRSDCQSDEEDCGQSSFPKVGERWPESRHPSRRGPPRGGRIGSRRDFHVVLHWRCALARGSARAPLPLLPPAARGFAARAPPRWEP